MARSGGRADLARAEGRPVGLPRPARSVLGKRRSRRLTATAFLALLAWTATAACSRGDHRAIDPRDPDAPCKVFTPAEVRSVVNIPPENNRVLEHPLLGESGRHLALIGLRYCYYKAQYGDLGLYVGLSTFPPEGANYAREVFDDAPGKPVKGLGVPAKGALIMLKGHKILQIEFASGSAGALERARRLAPKGLARL